MRPGAQFTLPALILAAVVILSATGCSRAYVIHLQDPQEQENIVFLANTSEIHFYNLANIDPFYHLVSRRPLFEGVFDRIYDMAAYPRVMEQYKKKVFTPEAEWLLVFKEPLELQKDEPDAQKLADLRIGFTGMIEGKFIDDLSGPFGRWRWRQASSGNNFYHYRDRCKPQLQYQPLKQWNEIFRSTIPTQYDLARVNVAYVNQAGATQTMTSTFGAMRRELFGPDPSTKHELQFIVRHVVHEFYKNNKDAKTKKGLRLVGINLGAHGDQSALVNNPARRDEALKEALRFENFAPNLTQMMIPGFGMDAVKLNSLASAISASKLCCDLTPASPAMTLATSLPEDALSKATRNLSPDVSGASPEGTETYSSMAIYNEYGELIANPLYPTLSNEIKKRKISDLYVISHGWNYTNSESIAYYENLKQAIDQAVKDIRKQSDPNYKPFYIFVSWNSVSRPVSQAAFSLLPLTPNRPTIDQCAMIDRVMFHIPSIWGESKNAALVSLGALPPEYYDLNTTTTRNNLIIRDKLTLENSVFNLIMANRDDVWRKEHKARYLDTKGDDIPLSLIIEHIMLLKRLAERNELDPASSENFRQTRLHVIGHSLGAKLISLATLEAINRAQNSWAPLPPPPRNAARSTPRRPALIDTMILFNGALTEKEMSQALRPVYGRPDFHEDPWKLGNESAQIYSQTFSDILLQMFGGKQRAQLFDQAMEDIERKFVVYTANDSTNGWVYLIGDMVISPYHVVNTVHVRFRLWEGLKHLSERYNPERFSVPYVKYPLLLGGKTGSFARNKFVSLSTYACLILASQFENLKRLIQIPVPSKYLVAPNGAIGSRGLMYKNLPWTKLRIVPQDVHQLSFHDLSTTITTQRPELEWMTGPNRFVYNIDAGEIYDSSRWLLPGAHNDMSADDYATLQDKSQSLRKFQCTFNFVHNITTRNRKHANEPAPSNGIPGAIAP